MCFSIFLSPLSLRFLSLLFPLIFPLPPLCISYPTTLHFPLIFPLPPLCISYPTTLHFPLIFPLPPLCISYPTTLHFHLLSPSPCTMYLPSHFSSFPSSLTLSLHSLLYLLDLLSALYIYIFTGLYIYIYIYIISSFYAVVCLIEYGLPI